MGILDLNLNEVPDLKTVSPGEYQLRVTSSEVKESKSGNPMVLVAMAIEDEADSQVVFDHLVLPTDDCSASQKNSRLRKIKAFCESFDIDYSAGGINPDEWKGLTGFAILSEESDAEYGDSNRIKRYQAGA